MVQKQKLKRLIPLAKICVSSGLIIFLIKIIDIETLKKTLAGINPIYLILSVAAMFGVLILASVRWRICLMPQGIDVSIANSVRYSLIGFFFNNFAPSTVGGDVAKGVIVGRSSKKKLGTAISILMDRLIGLQATGILALLALFASFGLPIDRRIRFLIAAFVFIVVSVLALILHRGASRRIASFLSRRKLENIADKVSSLSKAFSEYLAYPGFLKNALGISLVLQLANIWVNYIIAQGLGIELSFLYFLILIPLVTSVMSIPVSLNGLGLREGAFVLFFGMAGLSKEKALSISFSYYAIVLFFSMVGGILLLFSGLRKERRGE